MPHQSEEITPSPRSGGGLAVSGKGWKAYIPSALIVLAFGSQRLTSHEDEILAQVKDLRNEVHEYAGKVQALEVKLARYEGLRGRGPSDD